MVIMLFGKPKENLVQAACSVCKYTTETVELTTLDMFICKKCIERGLLYAADEAIKHAFDNRDRYMPPPPPPMRPLKPDYVRKP